MYILSLSKFCLILNQIGNFEEHWVETLLCITSRSYKKVYRYIEHTPKCEATKTFFNLSNIGLKST